MWKKFFPLTTCLERYNLHNSINVNTLRCNIVAGDSPVLSLSRKKKILLVDIICTGLLGSVKRDKGTPWQQVLQGLDKTSSRGDYVCGWYWRQQAGTARFAETKQVLSGRNTADSGDMAMQIALVGLTQSGKSSLFTALTGGHVHSQSGSAHQADKAVVKVPDHRLEVLTDIYKPKKMTPATIEFLDLPGLSFLDEPSRHDARRVIAQTRQYDMLVLVVRNFENEAVAKYRDRIDPAGDVDELRTELFLADLESVANRIEKLEKAITKPTKTQKDDKHELELMRRYSDTLENLKPLSDVIGSPEEEKFVRSFGFLTMKPVLVVLNVNEDKVNFPSSLTNEQACGEVLVLSASLEADLVVLDPDERSVFLEDMGLKEIARDRLIRMCYRTVNLISFLTVGSDEVRAWTVSSDCPAVEAAGAIHTDIQRGFIRAETISFDDFAAAGDMKAARAAGKVRLEGKQYPVQDGDIINFRFNV